MPYRHRVIPCLLLQNGRLVKTLRFQDPVYIGDPINTVRVFNDLQADELVFLDISASSNKKIDFDLIRRIGAEAYMPFSYGGGIQTIEDAAKLIANGVEKVIIGSAFFNQKGLVESINAQFGSQAVAVCLDYCVENNRCRVYTGSGKKLHMIDLQEAVDMAVSSGAGEILLSAIDRDGSMSGYDLETIASVAAKTQVPLIAVGGAAQVTDFKKVTDSGASAAAAGAMFCFMGSRKAVLINYPDRHELTAAFSSN